MRRVRRGHADSCSRIRTRRSTRWRRSPTACREPMRNYLEPRPARARERVCDLLRSSFASTPTISTATRASSRADSSSASRSPARWRSAAAARARRAGEQRSTCRPRRRSSTCSTTSSASSGSRTSSSRTTSRVVRHVSDRIAVMYLGRDRGGRPGRGRSTNAPTHPYTEALLSAIPVPNPERQRARERIVLQGEIPSPANPPSGCRFHTRCRYAFDPCRTVDPPAFTTPDGTHRCLPSPHRWSGAGWHDGPGSG